MDWETIGLKIWEYVLSFFRYAMDEGENKFMLVDLRRIYGDDATEGAVFFFIGSFVIMALLAVFACDSFRLLHPIEGFKEWKTKISIVSVVLFAAAVFSLHTFYKMLITLTGGALHAHASVDALKCLGTYMNPISVMVYAFAVSTMNFRKGYIQAMFLGWAVFLTPAVMTYDTWTQEHMVLYIAAISFGLAGAVLYQNYNPFICYFILSAVYFVCRFFMITCSAEMLILTSESWIGKIGQYFACAQMDFILTLLLLLILFGYREITTEREKLTIKKDVLLAGIATAFVVCAVTCNLAVEVHAVPLGQEGPEDYAKEEYPEDEPDEGADGEVRPEDNTVDEYISDNEPSVIFVVTTETANIRLGPSTDYDVITSVVKGTEFFGTGNEEVAKNGRVWYEIYINDDFSETGWASSTVIEKRDSRP